MVSLLPHGFMVGAVSAYGYNSGFTAGRRRWLIGNMFRWSHQQRYEIDIFVGTVIGFDHRVRFLRNL